MGVDPDGVPPKLLTVMKEMDPKSIDPKNPPAQLKELMEEAGIKDLSVRGGNGSGEADDRGGEGGSASLVPWPYGTARLQWVGGHSRPDGHVARRCGVTNSNELRRMAVGIGGARRCRKWRSILTHHRRSSLT